MKIQLNTDNHITGHGALAEHVTAVIEKSLAHFRDHVTRVEVHLGDENSAKAGQHDKRCLLEARLQGHQPLAVTDHAGSLHQALHGAAIKLERLLASTLGRLHDHRPHGQEQPIVSDEPV